LNLAVNTKPQNRKQNHKQNHNGITLCQVTPVEAPAFRQESNHS